MNANNGARVNIKNALRDWNIEAGTSHPIIVLSTPLSVNIFNDDPACSNQAQKIKENNINIPTTISLSLSSGEHFKREYPNQKAIHIAPNPPRRFPTSS